MKNVSRMSIKQIWLLFKTAFSAWRDDYAQSMGAALAYYTLSLAFKNASALKRVKVILDEQNQQDMRHFTHHEHFIKLYNVARPQVIAFLRRD